MTDPLLLNALGRDWGSSALGECIPLSRSVAFREADTQPSPATPLLCPTQITGVSYLCAVIQVFDGITGGELYWRKMSILLVIKD